MSKQFMVCFLPFILLLSFFKERPFPYGIIISTILIGLLFFGLVLSRFKEKKRLFQLTKMDLFLGMFLISSLFTTLFAHNFYFTLTWFVRILSAYCLYKLSNELEAGAIFNLLTITGTAASIMGIVVFDFIKEQGLIIPLVVYAQLAIACGLFQWSSLELNLGGRIKYFLFAFTNFLYLLLSSSRLAGFTTLLVLFLSLLSIDRVEFSLNFMRVIGALSCALLVYIPVSIIPGLGMRLGCYSAGLALAYIISRLFHFFTKGKKAKAGLFYLCFFLGLMLASAFITFTATNSWLERTTFNELFLLAGEKIGRFDPVILKNNLTILGTGQGFAYPATNSFTSLWIQQGILGFALVIFLLIFWFVVIARKYCKERRSSEGKIIFHALSGTLVMIIPSLFFDLTATFSVIYLGAVFIGAFQPFFVTNREVKTKVLIPLRAVVLAGVIFLVANQWKSALEIHYAYLGDRYLSLGKSLAARECFEKALKISPNNGDYYHKLALVAEQMGDDNLALDYVRQALNLNPREKELYALAGNLYLKQGDLEEADKYYLKITDAYEFYFLRYENLAASFLAKAQDLIKKGQREEAEEYFYKIQEIYSKMEEAYQRARERENKENQFEVSPRMKLIMSKCYYYLRDYDQSEKWAREAMQYPETRSSGIEILYFIRDQLEAGN